MVYENPSFELSHLYIKHSAKVENLVKLKCIYMEVENAEVTFYNVSSVENFDSLYKNTIKYVVEVDGGYIITLEKGDNPVTIEASSYKINWL